MTVFDPSVFGLRQKDLELLGILGNSWEGPGIVGTAPERFIGFFKSKIFFINSIRNKAFGVLCPAEPGIAVP